MPLTQEQASKIAKAIIYDVLEGQLELPQFEDVTILFQTMPRGFTAKEALDLICSEYCFPFSL